jgi:predicted DNA-binding WGR domain protein
MALMAVKSEQIPDPAVKARAQAAGAGYAPKDTPVYVTVIDAEHAVVNTPKGEARYSLFGPQGLKPLTFPDGVVVSGPRRGPGRDRMLFETYVSWPKDQRAIYELATDGSLNLVFTVETKSWERWQSVTAFGTAHVAVLLAGGIWLYDRTGAVVARSPNIDASMDRIESIAGGAAVVVSSHKEKGWHVWTQTGDKLVKVAEVAKGPLRTASGFTDDGGELVFATDDWFRTQGLAQAVANPPSEPLEIEIAKDAKPSTAAGGGYFGFDCGDWYEGANGGHPVEVRFARAPIEAERRKLIDAFNAALAKGAAEPVGKEWRWAGPWALFYFGKRNTGAARDAFSEVERALQKKVHKIVAIEEAVFLGARESIGGHAPGPAPDWGLDVWAVDEALGRTRFTPEADPAPAPAPAAPASAPASGVKRYTCTEDGASKFWSVQVDGAQLIVKFGRIGTEGQTKNKTLASPAAAEAEAQKLIREKTSKGYVPE